jgi:hypothetical protein
MTRTVLFGLALAAGCGGAKDTIPTRPPAEFCSAIVAGNIVAAGESARSAMFADGADKSADATSNLVEWLKAQSCVVDVRAANDVIETDPPVREIRFVLARDEAARHRSCEIDLVLTVGAKLKVHPEIWDTRQSDTRCTLVAPKNEPKPPAPVEPEPEAEPPPESAPAP